VTAADALRTRLRQRSRPGLGRDFRRLWTAAGISYLGDGISASALPLLAASLTSSAVLVGLTGAVGPVAWLFFGLVGGTLVDRWDRLRTMWLVDAARFALAAALACAVATGVAGIWLLLAAGLGMGMGSTLFDTSSQAVIPALVSERGAGLEAANGRLSVGQTVGEQFAGPPLGGFLFAITAAVPVFADAFSFALSAVLLRTLARRRPARPATERTSAVRPRLRAEIAEGVRWLRGQPAMLALAAAVGITNLAYTASSAVFVLYVGRILHLGPTGYGLLLAAIAAGAVVGGFSVVGVSRALGPARSLAAALAVAAVSRLGLGLTHQAAAAAVCLAAGGWALTVFAVIAVSLRQRLIPDQLRGRVLGAYRLIALGPEPIGALVGGVLVDRFGIRAPFLIGGVIIVVLAVAIYPVLANTITPADPTAVPALSGGQAPHDPSADISDETRG
jgi:MFS family permease